MTDITVHGVTYTLDMTCGACPEQYDVIDPAGHTVGYLRLRHGSFTAQLDDAAGPLVYSACPEGDGAFEDNERDLYLSAAVRAMHYRITGQTQPTDSNAELSKLLFRARESVDMLADIIEAQLMKPATRERMLVADIDQYRNDRGWSPHGFGGEN